MRRERGFGTLVSKGNGKPFLARWVHRGRVYTKSTRETDRRRALRELERLTRPFREERELDVLRALESRVRAAMETSSRGPSAAVSELFEKFKALPQAKDLTASSKDQYSRVAAQLAEFMKSRGVVGVDDVKEEDAAAFLEFVASRCGPVAYNVRLVFLKRLWREFGNGRNPFEKFQKRKASKESPRRALTEEEAVRVMAEAAKDPDDELLFSLGAYTGLRLSDCASLKVADVDLEAGLLRVVPIKTKRHAKAPLEIPMHPALRAVVEKALASAKGEYVSERNAKMYRRRTILKRTAAVFEAAGIKTAERREDGRVTFVCGFHSLRHTFVSMSIDAGLNPLLVQRVVGHTSAAMTDHYYHANRKVLEDGISKLPDFAA